MSPFENLEKLSRENSNTTFLSILVASMDKIIFPGKSVLVRVDEIRGESCEQTLHDVIRTNRGEVKEQKYVISPTVNDQPKALLGMVCVAVHLVRHRVQVAPAQDIGLLGYESFKKAILKIRTLRLKSHHLDLIFRCFPKEISPADLDAKLLEFSFLQLHCRGVRTQDFLEQLLPCGQEGFHETFKDLLDNAT